MSFKTGAKPVRHWWAQDDLDDAFLESYRNLLFGQYKSLVDPVSNEAAQAEAKSVLEMEFDKIGWEDLYRLESAIIKLEPTELLRRRAWILCNEYKEMASPDEFKDYIASSPPTADSDGDAALLRADLIRLQEELNWRYVLVWVLEAYRDLILRRLIKWTVVVVLLTLALTCWATFRDSGSSGFVTTLPLLATIIIPGVIGGLISTVRRIQAARFGNNADADLSQLMQGNTSIYLSPLLGGVFALILFYLFASGFVSGDLFPKVKPEDALIMSGLENISASESAKLIVWCFLAGFAENFVPDRLARIVSSSNQASSKTEQKK